MEQAILEKLKKYVPEVEDYEIEIVETFWNNASNKHSGNDEELLRIYLFGYLLTSIDDVDFESIKISNITLNEKANSENVYWKLYKKWLNYLDKDIATVSII